jgi:hypothetical protein
VGAWAANSSQAPSTFTTSDVTATGLRSTPFRALGCPNSMPLDGSSVWRSGADRKWYSCAARPGQPYATGADVRADGAGMCVDASGRPDYSSIVVDMSTLKDRTGCFAWVADDCNIDMRRVKKLEFDVDLTQCEALWAAPIWLSPLDWRDPQGLSGEVDFVEMCPVPTVATNLGCYSVPHSPDTCLDGGATHWGDASKPEKKHRNPGTSTPNPLRTEVQHRHGIYRCRK